MLNRISAAQLSFEIDTNEPVPHRDGVSIFEIMHKDLVVAIISERGEVSIYHEQFMPFDLKLLESDDYDDRVGNTMAFQHWCASRMLSLDRTHAKAILNAIGASQSPTDADRADIALSCHCVSLIDVHWVREEGEEISFEQINLYDNSLNEAIVELSLRGKSLTVTNMELVTPKDVAPDLSTRGLFPKAWIRNDDTFVLLKDGGTDTVRRELLASCICQCFDIPQVIYESGVFRGVPVTRSKIVTSKSYSIVPMRAYEEYCVECDLDYLEEVKQLDSISYYGMNILDYLTGNTDRHGENWGLLVDNETNMPISLHPLMDFNQCFHAYDSLDGAKCLTCGKQHMSQRDAAIEAVKVIGLRQISEVDMAIFGDHTEEAEMFLRRLEELRKFES